MSYEAGYGAAYAEIYTALDDPDHPDHCDGCRPCEVMKTTIHWTMQNLSRRLSSEKFFTLARILASAENKRIAGRMVADAGAGHESQ